MNDVLRRPTRERLRLFVASLGTGLAGRPDDIQAVLRRAFPGLRETRKTLRILGDQNRTIEQFIADADTVVTRLHDRRADVTDFIRQSRGAAETGASRRAELREGVRLPARLPGRAAAHHGRAVATWPAWAARWPDELRRSAPDATTLLQRLGPFADAARPALRALGEAAVPTTQGLRESGQELATLRALARDAPATVKPLRQTLQTLDDRRRAVDNDPRAALTAPPGARPHRQRRGPRLHRLRVDRELLLLADHDHQRLRRHRPPAAGGRHGVEVQPVPQRAAHRRRQRAAVPGLQLLARPTPAGDQRA